MPKANVVQRARLDAAVRDIADRTTADMPPAWEAAVRAASIAKVDQSPRASTGGRADRPRSRHDALVVARGAGAAVAAARDCPRRAGWVVGVAAMSLPRATPTRAFRRSPGARVPLLMLVGGLVAGLALGSGVPGRGERVGETSCAPSGRPASRHDPARHRHRRRRPDAGRGRRLPAMPRRRRHGAQVLTRRAAPLVLAAAPPHMTRGARRRARAAPQMSLAWLSELVRRRDPGPYRA